MINLLRTRRSVRKFTGQPIEREKLEILKEAILRSPTSKNSMACEFIFVDDQELIQKLSQSKPSGAGALHTAQLAVVVLAKETQTVAWIEDSSIASIILQLTAHALQLGSCWIQIRGREHSEEKSSETFVRETLNIPDGLRVLSIVALGYTQRTHEGRPIEELKFEKIHRNGF
ncbi:MAG: nitroreductase family protein [Prolixibacteraceae bacterium]|nr:nitroreductase family protein [Prolixibacteraceae bacterium]